MSRQVWISCLSWALLCSWSPESRINDLNYFEKKFFFFLTHAVQALMMKPQSPLPCGLTALVDCPGLVPADSLSTQQLCGTRAQGRGQRQGALQKRIRVACGGRQEESGGGGGG